MKRAVLAIGGNSLIRRSDRQSVADQYAALCATMEHVADVVALGWQVLITHGNGPQVDFIMLRSEIAKNVAGLHRVPLDSCVADTQGAIGYQIQQALENALRRRNAPGHAVTVITQTVVDAEDPAFASPDKCLGEFYTAEERETLLLDQPDWILQENATRGWQRVVPHPKPVRFAEVDAIETLLQAGFHVVAAGGGGISVVQGPQGLQGVEAMLDKDLTSSLLASTLHANLLIISTSVEKVALNFATPMQTPLDTVPVADMERYLAEGHFPEGNMGPKIRGAIEFIRHGGERVIITSPEFLHKALTSGAGTHIVP